MPAKRGGKKNRSRRRLDVATFPLAYSFDAGHGGKTTVATISDSFDRRRPFRIAEISGELSASGFPVLVQFQAYGPVSSADNIWSSKEFVVPTGTTRKFRYHLPATMGWFPSDAVSSTPLLVIYGDCVNKERVGRVTGVCFATVLLRPIEVQAGCPTLQMETVDGAELRELRSGVFLL